MPVDTMTAKAVQDVLNDADFWEGIRQQMYRRFWPVSRRIVVQGIESAENIGVVFTDDVVNEQALGLVRQWMPEWWSTVEATTREGLRTAIDTWLSLGLGKRGMPDLIDAIEPLFGRKRAERIAATEVTRLFAEGQKLAGDADPEVVGYVWLTAQDELVCPICAPRHGKIYPKGQVPDIPAHVHDRCNLHAADARYVRAHRAQWQGAQLPPRGVA